MSDNLKLHSSQSTSKMAQATMEDVQAAAKVVTQPLAKMAQANMALISEFALSPEVMGQSVTMMQGLIEQSQKSTIKLAQSHAFTRMMEGLLQNYTDFMTEMTHSAMGMMNTITHQQKALVERTA